MSLEDSLRFEEPFAYEARAGAPAPPEPPGLRLNVTDVRRDGERLSLRVHASFAFDERFKRSFLDIRRALVLHVEDAASGEAAATQLHDPFEEEPRTGPRPNFHGNAEGLGSPTVICGGHVSFALSLALPEPAAGPVVFLHLTLQRHVSNVLAVSVADGNVTSYSEGSPRAVEIADLPAR